MHRILIADDDTPFREGLAEWLRRHGYACDSAPTGADAIQLLQTQTYDAMISDIHMPGNAGLELIKSMPEPATGMPVILLTGHPTVETAASSVRLSVAAYLVKPPNPQELLTLVAEVSTSRRRFRLVMESRARLKSWGEELEQISLQMEKRNESRAASPLSDYLRVTLRNVVLQLADLERSAASLRREEEETELRQLDLVGALRRTVEVLEKTKQNFKSKDLADLRQQLESLLRTNEPGKKSGSS